MFVKVKFSIRFNVSELCTYISVKLLVYYMMYTEIIFIQTYGWLMVKINYDNDNECKIEYILIINTILFS